VEGHGHPHVATHVPTHGDAIAPVEAAE
jgi:hypothetical protein